MSITFDYTVELNGKHGWYPFMGNHNDLFAARELAARLAASTGKEARITDSDGQVWA
ncbi:MAG: hypothetical protein JWQ12_672 [Glaciihabitans sp.]|nr:hypothetical protein [Glaciihabitans sp.]